MESAPPKGTQPKNHVTPLAPRPPEKFCDRPRRHRSTGFDRSRHHPESRNPVCEIGALCREACLRKQISAPTKLASGHRQKAYVLIPHDLGLTDPNAFAQLQPTRLPGCDVDLRVPSCLPLDRCGLHAPSDLVLVELMPPESRGQIAAQARIVAEKLPIEQS